SPAMSTRRNILASDLRRSFAAGRVPVLSDDDAFLRNGIQHLRLICGIHWTDRNTGDALRQQVIDNLALAGSRPIGNAKLDGRIAQFLTRRFDALAGNGPEIRRVVGDKRQLY